MIRATTSRIGLNLRSHGLICCRSSAHTASRNYRRLLCYQCFQYDRQRGTKYFCLQIVFAEEWLSSFWFFFQISRALAQCASRLAADATIKVRWRLKMHLFSQNVQRLLMDHSKNDGRLRSSHNFVATVEFSVSFLPFSEHVFYRWRSTHFSFGW